MHFGRIIVQNNHAIDVAVQILHVDPITVIGSVTIEPMHDATVLVE